jgi:hypothetical protein
MVLRRSNEAAADGSKDGKLRLERRYRVVSYLKICSILYL